MVVSPEASVEGGPESFGAHIAYRRVTSPAIVRHRNIAGYSHAGSVKCNAWFGTLRFRSAAKPATTAARCSNVVAQPNSAPRKRLYAPRLGEVKVRVLENEARAVANELLSPQLTAFFTSALILASSAVVNSFRAKAVGHMAPSSRFASCMKPSVVYLVLNFCALWKKQTTFPSLA
jgi:hypothetical protein